MINRLNVNLTADEATRVLAAEANLPVRLIAELREAAVSGGEVVCMGRTQHTTIICIVNQK